MSDQLIPARPHAPRIALIIDGYHLIYASRLSSISVPDKFDALLKLAILRVINTLHGAGYAVGQVNFHHAEPLNIALFKAIRSDSALLGFDPEPSLKRYRGAYHAVKKLADHKFIEGIPFQAVLGRTRYNGFRLDSRKVSTLQADSTREDISKRLVLDIKQKAVDTTIVVDILYFSELVDPQARDGFALVATDTDFIPALNRANQLLGHNALHQQRPAYACWVGIENETCPYPVISPQHQLQTPLPRRQKKA